jgi:hypothetical protein
VATVIAPELLAVEFQHTQVEEAFLVCHVSSAFDHFSIMDAERMNVQVPTAGMRGYIRSKES